MLFHIQQGCLGVKLMPLPAFWSNRSLLSNLLAPVGKIVGMLASLRVAFARPKRISIPVICVGNLVVGGAGKTPIVLSLAGLLKERGVKVHCLSRGYGGRIKGPHQVNKEADSAEDVGDEPLLLAGVAPTWVSVDRAAGGHLAELDGAQVLLMDDGFQNFSMAKDFSILVIDSEYGLGNQRVMPAGPLRETVSRGCRRADLVVLLGGDNQDIRSTLPFGMPILTCRLAVEKEYGDLQGKSVLAFAGIGRPEKFFSTLKTLDFNVIRSISFPDHHAYTDAEIYDLQMEAKSIGAVLVTTEKDKVRIPYSAQSSVEAIPVEVVWDDEQAVDSIVAKLTKIEGA